jgi:hypothetical protein
MISTKLLLIDIDGIWNNVFFFAEYLMSGSPRTYPTTSTCKPPKSPAGMQVCGGGGGPSSKDFLQPGDTAGLAPAAKTSSISSQHRWVNSSTCQVVMTWYTVCVISYSSTCQVVMKWYTVCVTSSSGSRVFFLRRWYFTNLTITADSLFSKCLLYSFTIYRFNRALTHALIDRLTLWPLQARKQCASIGCFFPAWPISASPML